MLSLRGKSSTRLWWVLYAGGLLLFFAVSASCTPLVPITGNDEPTATPLPPADGTIPVTVVDGGQSVNHGVVVRVSNSAQVDGPDNGGLKIESCDPNTQVIAAWAKDYEVTFGKCNEPNIRLTPLNSQDNVYYSWASALGDCINCHNGQIGSTYNEVNEWLRSGHANEFDRRYFETMYRGINLSGISSPVTQWTMIGNNRVRVPPATTDGYYHGPGYKLDFPEQPGNCAYCHAPAAVPPSQVNVDLLTLFPKHGDVRREGITCDVCHKVLDVALDSNGFPFVDRPGVLSFQFLRSDNGAFSTGPFANILTRSSNIPTERRLACSPIFSQSEFCAACHYGKVGNMVIYNSYGEWKQSVYGSNPDSSDYKTCQDCHMLYKKAAEKNPPSSRAQACSEGNPKLQDFNHNLMDFGIDETSGQEIPRLIKNAAKVKVDFKYEPKKKNSINVLVRVQNTEAGHKFPTDSPLRHLILVVDARDQLGTSLLQVGGEQIPNWGGSGKISLEPYGIKNYGGLPGKIFADLLVEEDTNISPAEAYWNKTKFAWVNGDKNSDTRLMPGEKDSSDYSFTIPNAGEIKITVSLVYRFAFFDLMAQKEWNRPDITVTSVECKGPPTEPDQIECKASK